MSRVCIQHAAEIIVENTGEGMRDADGSKAVFAVGGDHVPKDALATGRGLPGVSEVTHSTYETSMSENELPTGGESLPDAERRAER